MGFLTIFSEEKPSAHFWGAWGSENYSDDTCEQRTCEIKFDEQHRPLHLQQEEFHIHEEAGMSPFEGCGVFWERLCSGSMESRQAITGLMKEQTRFVESIADELITKKKGIVPLY